MSSVYLAHHGIKGMRWGIRQYQNPDGSLTPAGRIRYGAGAAVKVAGSAAKTVGKATGAVVKTTGKAVGSAAKTVSKAVRKKVAPTDAELDEQIEAEKSKIRHKEKKEELKRLKETGKIEDPNDEVGHKKYSQMSDKEVDSRITRLKKEAELAELEFTKDMGPGKRMVLKALRDGTSKGISVATQTAITKLGKAFSDNILKDDSDDKSDKNDGNDSNNSNNSNNGGNNSGGKKKNKNKQNNTQNQSSGASSDDKKAAREKELGQKLGKARSTASKIGTNARIHAVATKAHVETALAKSERKRRLKKWEREDFIQNKKRVRHSGMELVYIPRIDK